MQIPLQISLHGIGHSDALYNAIREKAEKLERYYGHIMSCRVVLELGGRHKRHGKQFSVRIDLRVPGGELAVTREHDEDAQIAIREAFDAARRQLEDHARRRDGGAKARQAARAARKPGRADRS
jgi:ribosomal subunit interface protein